MKPILGITLALLWLIPITVRGAAPASSTQPSKDISALLAPVIQKHDVPGMAAAVVQSGEIVAIGVAGVRMRGKPDKIATDDRWAVIAYVRALQLSQNVPADQLTAEDRQRLEGATRGH